MMNQTPLFAEERKKRILELLHELSKITVPQLSTELGVSPVTIRNDLRELEAEGKLLRTHGGALPVGKVGFEPDSEAKKIANIEAKRRIAVAAAMLVESGDTIALDAGTTTFELAHCLRKKDNITVITNDLRIATLLEAESPGIQVFVSGGMLRHGFQCMVGPMAERSLEGIHVDRAFMAANAVSLEEGFSTPHFEQAAVKRRLMSIASKRVMLCDSSKLGRCSFARFCGWDEIELLIMDSGVGEVAAQAIREKGEEIELTLV